jgi:hypothetical protein
MDMHIWKCNKLCGDYHKLASLQTSTSGKNLHRLFNTSMSIHQDDDTTNHSPFLLHWWSTILGLNMKQKNNIDHLIGAIKSTHNLTKNWTGNLYCGITLDWDNENRTVDISMWMMLGYIKKKLQDYKHVMSIHVQNCPYSPAPKQYGSKAQAPLHPDQCPHLNEKGIK